ncbi:MAG: hypothetical protein EPO21_19195 [Chloroflexota bacterium]|nr:MAG: hypothetical protein EPO21_19195 [Chloroflexota bacterium]
MTITSSRVTAPARSRASTYVAVLVFGVLFALLFQYRILSLLSKLGTNVAPLGTKLPIVLDLQNSPLWLRPFLSTLDYLNTVWSTTLLGLFIAGAAVTFLPHLLRHHLQGNGIGQHLAAAVLGLPNMFCTCCAATTLPGLRKAGMGLAATLSFFVAAPALNMTVIILAFQLLPLKLALARAVLGLVAAVGVPYLVVKLHPEVSAALSAQTCEVDEGKTAVSLLSAWLRATLDIARVAIPFLLVGILIVSIFKVLLPFDVIARSLGDGLAPTLLASLVGVVLMVPSYTEVLWIGEFTKQGMGTGPAAALLITLPAVSFPSLWVLARVHGSYRLAVSLGLGVLLLGVVGGLLFALI